MILRWIINRQYVLSRSLFSFPSKCAFDSHYMGKCLWTREPHVYTWVCCHDDGSTHLCIISLYVVALQLILTGTKRPKPRGPVHMGTCAWLTKGWSWSLMPCTDPWPQPLWDELEYQQTPDLRAQHACLTSLMLCWLNDLISSAALEESKENPSQNCGCYYNSNAGIKGFTNFWQHNESLKA